MTFGKIAGLDVARPAQLAVVLFMCALGFAFLRLRPAVPGGGAPLRFTRLTPERRSVA